jgi:hypothetical protein
MTNYQINLIKVGGFLFLIVLILISGCSKEGRIEYKLRDCVLLNLYHQDTISLIGELNNSDISKISPTTIICKGIGGRTVVYTGGYVSDIEFNKLVDKYNSSLGGNVEARS